MARIPNWIAVACISICIGRFVWVDEDTGKLSHRGPAFFAIDPFFADEVWAKVGETTCLKCHRADGEWRRFWNGA